MTGRAARSVPTLDTESAMFAAGVEMLAACDEVGRGALAGPVTVGVVVIDAAVAAVPDGLRDSKLLHAPDRRDLCPALRAWALDHAIGHATAEEIDRYGVVAALRMAGWRALVALSVRPDAVLLDGSHDWLTPPSQSDLFGGDEALETLSRTRSAQLRVVTKVKADLTCASVAAASVLAKVERDQLMDELARTCPQYGWDTNKGYGTTAHRHAIDRLGPTVWHRRTWRLTG